MLSASRAPVKQPRLLLLSIAAGGIGGTEQVVVNLASAFRERGWDVRTVFPAEPRPLAQATIEWARSQGVVVETTDALKDIITPRGRKDVLALRRFISAARPDVVNIHYGVGHASLKDVIAARLSGRHRLVLTIHHPAGRGDVARAQGRATRLSAMLTSDVIAVSRATRATLLWSGVPQRKLHVVFNGLVPPTSRPPREAARAALGLPPDAFIVGSVARLVQEKRIADLIAAVARIPDPHEQLFLAIAGTGPERDALEAAVPERLRARVRFLGRVPELEPFYAALDLFCLPSSMEGFGLVYLEAAFHGVPSIGTDVGGVPDAVVDGETGILVPPGNISALALGIERLWHDGALRQRLGEAARVRAEAEFTAARMAERYATLFET